MSDDDQAHDSLEQFAADLDADGQPIYAWRARQLAGRLAAERDDLDRRVLPAMDSAIVEPTALVASADAGAPIFDAVHDDLGITPTLADDTEGDE